MHSCTCPFNGIPSMENNRLGEEALGCDISGPDHVFHCISYCLFFYHLWFILMFSDFSLYCDLFYLVHEILYKTLMYSNILNDFYIFYYELVKIMTILTKIPT